MHLGSHQQFTLMKIRWSQTYSSMASSRQDRREGAFTIDSLSPVDQLIQMNLHFISIFELLQWIVESTLSVGVGMETYCG